MPAKQILALSDEKATVQDLRDRYPREFTDTGKRINVGDQMHVLRIRVAPLGIPYFRQVGIYTSRNAALDAAKEIA
jgi:hypothetical protein